MHLSTLAALAAAFASVAYAIPAEAAEAATEATEGTEATEATKDIQHYYARYIANVATGTNLDLYKGESCPKDGKPVPVNGWAGTLINNKNTHQIWVIELAGPNDHVQIMNLGSSTPVYCRYESKATYGRAFGGPTQVNSHSKFYARANGDGTFTFQSVARWGNKNMCLDLAGGKKDNGTPVYCYPCHGAANQRWNLRGITYNQLKSFGVGV